MPVKIDKLTSFAAGILLSTSIIGAVFYFGQDTDAANAGENKKEVLTAQLSEEEMIDILTDKGYQVLPETINVADQNILSGEETLAADEDGQTAEDSEAKPESEEAAEETDEIVINGKEGWTSIDVGEELSQAGLIDNDAFQFSKDIEARNLHLKLRPGSYTVNSNMSYDQIISAIFNK